MATTTESPGVTGGVLVTVAFLKAQMDAGNDHLGIFVPLVLDVIGRLPLSAFTVEVFNSRFRQRITFQCPNML
jgi:hypothetical protein